MTTTTTPTADLLEHARARAVPLTRRGAQKLLDRLGPERARERLDMIAALRDLASAHGRGLSALAAVRRLDVALADRVHVGIVLERRRREANLSCVDIATALDVTPAVVRAWESGRSLPSRLERVVLALGMSLGELQYEAAAVRLGGERDSLMAAEFVSAYGRFERQFYADDAHRRHAAFLSQFDHGSLGHRATLLLMAAAEAGLRRPDAAGRRAQLWGLCDVEFARRHQVAADARTRDDVVAEIAEVVPDDPIERTGWEAEHRRYVEHTARAADDERRARELAEAQLLGPSDDETGERRRDLAIALNLLDDHPTFRGDVERILRRMRSDLAAALERRDAGRWNPDPRAYHAEVIERAADAARRAA